MSASTLAPLSPRACSRMATSLLEHLAHHDPVDGEQLSNSLWTIRGSGSAPSPTLLFTFDTVDDLLGVSQRGVRAVALIVESRLNGLPGWTSIVQSTCGCAAVAVLRDGEPLAVSVAEVSGYLLDLTRRVVGLETAVEPTPPIEAITACWLSDVLDVAADPTTSNLIDTWWDVVAMHPTVGHLASAIVDLPAEAFATVVDVSVEGLEWEELRRLAVAGEPDCAGLSAAEAAWMDEGMFARWTLGSHRDVDELLDDCSLFLKKPTIAALRRAVGAIRH